MNESKNYSIVEIILVLLFVFGIFIYFVFFKSFNKQNIINSDTQNSEREISTSTTRVNQDSLSIYYMYIAKKQSMQGSSEEEILSSVNQDLQNKISLPTQATPTISVGNFDKKVYNQKFEDIYQEEKKLGMTDENKIFKLQYQNEDLFIPLADYDRDTLLRCANLYTEFANKIESLDTPTFYKIKGEETVKAARNVNYILNQLRKEKDESIYKLWVAQYLQQMNVIIFTRYVQE